MTTVADSVVIDVPADVAWRFVSDLRKLHAVVPNTDIRLLSGTFDTVGSRYLTTTQGWGQTIDATHEIVRLEAPRLIETRTTSQGSVSRSLMQIEPVRDGACVLVVQGDMEWGGSFTAFVSRIATGLMGRRTFFEYLERVKQAIEQRSDSMGEAQLAEER